MKRREFLSLLGFTTGAAALDPRFLFPAAPLCEVFPNYPVPSFTGFKQSQDMPLMAGRFLFAVLWKQNERTGLTYWYQQCTIDLLRVREHGAPKKFIRHQISMAFASYAYLVDSIVEKARRGLVETTENPIMDRNPIYDPLHAATHNNDDDRWDCMLCTEFTRVANRDIPVQRARILSQEQLLYRPVAGVALPIPHDDLWDLPIESPVPIDIPKLIDDIAAAAFEKIRV